MSAGDYYPNQNTCPNCGYCPACGRPNYKVYPWRPSPYWIPYSPWVITTCDTPVSNDSNSAGESVPEST